MRGGTVLHKAHLAPAARYSEDIDLVLVKAMEAFTWYLDREGTQVGRDEANALVDARLSKGDQ